MKEILTVANDNEVIKAYDREAVAKEAMHQARELVHERGFEELKGNERFDAVVALMKELAKNNSNRHVVEALAQILTVEKADHDAWITSERYAQVKAAA